MFEDTSQETIEELRQNTTSRTVIRLVVKAAQSHLQSLKAMRISNTASKMHYEGKRAAYFEAASIFEEECWGTNDFSGSYESIILSVHKDKSLPESIKTLEGWIQNAKDNGF